MAGLADGLRLPEDRSAKLNKEQKEVQEITGGLKYPEKVMPRITLFVHRLSTVMSFPCLRAIQVALLTLEEAWNHRFEGLTFGGEGPDGEEATRVRMHAHFDMSRPGAVNLEAFADATWGCERDVYGYALMHNRGCIARDEAFGDDERCHGRRIIG